MSRVSQTPMSTAHCGGDLAFLRRRLAEVECWADGSVKEVARAVLRAEIARVGRAMVELDWRWA